MSWKPELEELKKRKALAKKMGGAEKVKRHRDAGNDHGYQPVSHLPFLLASDFTLLSVLQALILDSGPSEDR